MSHNAPFVITFVYTISSIRTFDHVTSSVTLAQVHTARHLYLRCLNSCNAEMVLYIYRAAILIWRMYRRWLTLFVPVNYCTFSSMHLCLFFFLTKSLYVVFGCTLSTNKMILLPHSTAQRRAHEIEHSLCLLYARRALWCQNLTRLLQPMR